MKLYQSRPTIEPILLTSVQVITSRPEKKLTNASGFFFEREQRLFLVTSRHVMIDESNNHFPEKIEVEIHTDLVNLSSYMKFSVPLYRDGRALWRQGKDTGGEIDVAVIELDRGALPHGMVFQAFTPNHLQESLEKIEVGTALSIICFPLGFHDALYHTPVVRHAIVASSFGMRFQGKGYFLTDARTHRGTSGAPIVMRATSEHGSLGDLQWILLGIHSARMDIGTRDAELDEVLGLNCAWYADILMTLTD
ncbi:trypsin-like peptidase domain-containing protein [Aurantivibrio plasticivorans]